MFIITGVSSGIGKYLFQKYSVDGNQVYGTYNKNKPISDCKNIFKVDITNYWQVSKWVSDIEPELKKIKLINCAGVNYSSFAHKADINSWSHVINVNLIGTFNVIHSLLPCMRSDGFGRIINLSSVVAQTPVPGTSAYASSKSGLSGLIKSIASENANKGITINNINLGYFNIGMINEVSTEYKNNQTENSIRRIWRSRKYI